VSELPPGWASATVGEIATLTDGPFGSNLKTSHYVESGPRVVRLQNIGEGVFRDERAHITLEHFQGLAKHEVVAGDVVAASLGDNPPRACLVPSWLGPAIVKADCIRIRPTGVDPCYLMWMLNSRPVRAQAALRVKGIGRPRLGLGGIRQLAIPVPPLNEQRRIVVSIEEHFSRLDSLETTIETIVGQFERGRGRVGALRRSILVRAFSGQLVPQDPSDEPAYVLLDRIIAERSVGEPSGLRRRARR
jgi:type I restriction enzyme S subunit